MKTLKATVIVFCFGLLVGTFGDNLTPSSRRHTEEPATRYRLDASNSKFIAHALRGGLLWFKGHEHLVAVRDFAGEVQLGADSVTASSLQITARTETMEETNTAFTDQQKKIINKELHEI